MVCQDCKKREATVHLTQIVNNEKTSLSLCKECAAARGFHSPLDNIPFPLADILSNLASKQPGSVDLSAAADTECEECGLTFGDFTRQGRFGCGNCYEAFRSQLELIMRKIHGASMHLGRTPEPIARKSEDEGENLPIPVKEEERLESELRKAIDGEDFERAAEIRDKLKAMKQATSVDD